MIQDGTCDGMLERHDNGDRSPEVESHVTTCPECRAVLAIDSAVRGLRPQVVSSEEAFMSRLRARLAPRRIALRFAAAAAVAIGIGVALWAKGHRREIPVERTTGPAPVIVKAPDVTRPSFHQRLLEAASGIGREEFLPALREGVERARWVASFRSSDPEERAAAVTIAAILKDSAVAPDLAWLGARGDSSAIAALGQIGAVECVAVLASLAGAPERRAEVEAALAATGRPEAAETLAALGAWENRDAWTRLGPAASATISSRLRSGGDNQLKALTAAGWAKVPATVPEVAKLLESPATRAAAAAALASIGGPKAVAALVEAAQPDDTAVITALRMAGGRELLEKRMRDGKLRDPERQRAVLVLGKMGDAAAAPALVAAIGVPETRMAAISALGDLRAPSTVPALTALLTDRKLRASAADALARIGAAEALPALAAAARDRSFREEAWRAIATIGTPQALPLLIAALGDRETAEIAMAGLAKLKDSRAIVPLIGALEGEHGAEAKKALQEITGEKLPGRKSDWMKWYQKRPKEGANLGAAYG